MLNLTFSKTELYLMVEFCGVPMATKKSFPDEQLKKLLNLSQIQNSANVEEDDDEGGGSDSGGIALPEPFTLIELMGALRDGEKNYGKTPNNDITKDRLLAKQQQTLSERGELEQSMQGQQEAHPILANSAYFSGIDVNVNPQIEFMTEEEAQRYAEQLQYQQRKRLEKQLSLSSAPTFTRS